MNFRFEFSAHPHARRKRPAASFRILVLGDFSGRSSRSDAPRGEGLVGPRMLDPDNFDAEFRRLAPAISLSLLGSAPIEIRFEDSADFHPDALYDRLDLFAESREMRRRLNDASTFPQAAAELRSRIGDAVEAPESESIDGLLSRERSARRSATRPFDAFLRAVVAPHIVAAVDPARDELVAALDRTIVEQMGALLHDPAYQRLEAGWISLRGLVTQPEIGESIAVGVIDIGETELASAVGDGSAAAPLHQLLIEQGVGVPGGQPWSIVVADFRFGDSVESLHALGALGAIAASAGGPLLASATPALAGLGSDSEPSKPAGAGGRPLGELADAWAELRDGEVAHWIGLTVPRLLARLPYGAASDAIERFEFEEIESPAQHDRYLWTSAGYAVAGMLARAEIANAGRLGAGDLAIEGLPVHAYRDAAGDTQMKACAESFLSESAGIELAARGLIPILSVRNRDSAIVMRLQSIAKDGSGLRGTRTG